MNTKTNWKDRMSQTKEPTQAVVEGQVLSVAEPVKVTAPPVEIREVAPAAPTDQFSQLIAVVNKLIENPDLDLDRVERFLSMARELRAERAKTSFTRDKAAMQAVLPVIDENGAIVGKDKSVVQSTYAYYEDIMEVVKPILSRFGFDLDFADVEITEGMVSITATLAHVEGHERVSTWKIPMDDPFGKNTIQRYASAASYAKRYAATALLNLTSRQARKSDDDGNGTSDSEVKIRALNAIEMFTTLADLIGWQKEQWLGIEALLNPAEAQSVIAAWNLKKKRLKEEAAGQ